MLNGYLYVILLFMSFVAKDGGFLIEKKVLWGAGVPNADYVNLGLQEGESMIYEKFPYILIDYPGEYDMQDMFIKVSADKTGKLNYFIQEGTRSFAIIQSPHALEEDEISEATVIYYTDESVEKMIDKLEIESQKEKLVV